MKNREYDNLNLIQYHEVLENGLKVNIIKKKDFKKCYVVLGTNYGSIDHNFMINDKTYNTPAGIAHFLEHKLFEMPDFTDAFVTLSKLGVNSNAYTSLNKTAYLFSTTNDIIEPLNILLDFVYTPFFDKESVDREKGIIASEINMYKDYPDHLVELEVIKNLFAESTLAEDIAGEVSDIMQTTPETLRQNYDAFYNPSNMSLVIVGDIDEEKALNEVRNFFKDKNYENNKITRLDNIENSKIGKLENIIHGNVVLEKFAIGFKMLVNKEEANIVRLKKELALEGLLYILFSESSEIYQDLLDKKLIMPEAGTRADFGKNYRYALFESDSKQPKKAVAEIRKILTNLNNDMISSESFERYKKYTIGKIYLATNSVDAIANNFLDLDLLSIDYFKMLEAIEELQIEDIYEIIKEIKKDEIVSAILLKK